MFYLKKDTRNQADRLACGIPGAIFESAVSVILNQNRATVPGGML